MLARIPSAHKYYFDIGQASSLVTDFPDIPPSERIVAVRRQNRILLVMIHYDLVEGIVHVLCEYDLSIALRPSLKAFFAANQRGPL
jgi:hypothetical protein